jgi:DNA-binding NtrC family response regulator
VLLANEFTENSFGELIAASAAMQHLVALLERVAPTSATILLEGESGTGKSRLAEAIHLASGRRASPFVVVDCGAIAPSLIESELFGRERGAFTGANEARAGLFEAANGGTLFLDEIGNLPLGLQPRLLRVLEKRVITRLGSTAPIELNVRIVAATNRDLATAVNLGQFRADLFYRLATLRIRLPRLRDRPEDIPLLAAHFYRELTGEVAPPELLVSMAGRSWPGNVRELRSAIERAALLGRDAGVAGHSNIGIARISFRVSKKRAGQRRWIETTFARSSGAMV